MSYNRIVIPDGKARAGSHAKYWIPAFAGTTENCLALSFIYTILNRSFVVRLSNHPHCKKCPST